MAFHTREADRVALEAPILLHCSGAPVQAVLRDLSTKGFMAESAETVWIGSMVDLAVPGAAPLPAQVRWALEGWFGCKFQDDVDWPKLGPLLPPSTDGDDLPST